MVGEVEEVQETLERRRDDRAAAGQALQNPSEGQLVCDACSQTQKEHLSVSPQKV